MFRLRLAWLFLLQLLLMVIVGASVRGLTGVVVAFLLILGFDLYAYWNADRLVLRLYGARPVDPEKSRALIAVVADLARRAKVPMPRVYLIDSAQPNAFATGRDPAHAAIALTTGLLKTLSVNEVAGVLAHEIAHIKNRDILIMSLAAALAGAIGLTGRLAYAAGGRGSGGGDGVIAVLLAPLAAFLIQMAVSRSREFEADRTGALLIGRPFGLAGALSRLEEEARRIPNPVAQAHPASAHLFIVNPFRGGGWRRLFSTHPDTAERIRRLLALGAEGGAPPPVP